jgi:hypothetical protein
VLNTSVLLLLLLLLVLLLSVASLWGQTLSSNCGCQC